MKPIQTSSVEEQVVEQPGDAVHEHREAHEREDPGGDPDHRALDELGDLLADLGLGELDLLADQDRDALGDVEDQLADRPVVRAAIWRARGPRRRSLRRILLEDADPDRGGDPVGEHAGQGAGGRQEPRPEEPSEDVVLHFRYLAAE